MIKIIDSMSRITAVVLAMSSFIGYRIMISLFEDCEAPMESKVSIGDAIIFDGIILIFSCTLQLGLFLAPVARQKNKTYRVITGILMLPSFLLLFGINAQMLIIILVKSSTITIINLATFVICSMGFIVYLIQYYLLSNVRDKM